MRKVVVAMFVALATLYAGAAGAAPDVEFSAALLVGNGFRDTYNLGIGARAGLTLPMRLYAGATFVYHLGEVREAGRFNVSALGGEVGYALGDAPITFRPYLGTGFVSSHVPVPENCRHGGCGSLHWGSDEIAFWTGLTLLVGVGHAFVGGDARYAIVLDSSGDLSAGAVFATGGAKF